MIAIIDNYDKNIDTKIKNILDQIGFVVVRSKKKINRKKIIKYYGKPINLNNFSIDVNNKILELEPYISDNINLSGFQFGEISLHTDTGFFKKSPVEYVFIQMIREDIIDGKLYGNNGIVDVFRIVQRLKGSNLLKKLTNYRYPFINRKTGKVMFKPIIELTKDGDLKLVRFHIDRIMSAYRYIGMTPKNKEIKLLNKFLNICYHHVKNISLRENDILIIDNHLMLHSRTDVNIEITKNGNTIARKVKVAFVRKHK